MKFTDVFINRPVLGIVLNIAIVIGGWAAIQGIGVRQFPEVSSSMVTVRTLYPGASAETMKGFVTAPIERALASVDGLDYIESSSAASTSTVNLRLRLNADASAALGQVSAKVSEVRADLPPGAEPPTINIERADSRFAAAYLSFTSDSMDLLEVTDYVVRNVQPELLSVAGVQRADILGGRQYAMRVWLDPDRMNEHGVSPTEIWAAIENQNWLAAPGQTRSELRIVGLSTNTDRKSAEQFRELVVATREGRTIRLGDVATVELGAESTEVTALYKNKDAVFVGIWVLPTANQLAVLGEVKKRLEEIRPRFPEALEGGIIYDSSGYVKNSLKEIVKTLLETVLIVGVVVFLFLGSLRAAVVPLVAIPISLIGVGLLMGAMGFSVNLLTLLAIVLAVGLVVDDAIVVVENIQRLIQSGIPPKEAALQAARQLAGPVIAMTITLAAVYAPIGMQKGLTGALFREFVFTLAGTVVISGVVALTLSPLLSAAVLRPNQNPGWIAKLSTRAFLAARRFYTRLLGRAVRHASSVVLVAVVVTLLIPVFYLLSWSELAPREDQDEINIIATLPPDASEDYNRFFGHQLGELLREAKGVDYTYALLAPGLSFAGLVTKPFPDRDATTAQMVEDLYPQVATLSGFDAFPMLPAPLPGAGDYDMEVVLVSSRSPGDLADLAGRIVEKLRNVGLFLYVDTDLKIDRPDATVAFDFEKMGFLGVDARTVASDLSIFTGGASVNRFERDGRSFKVLPEVTPQDVVHPGDLLNLPVSAPGGGLMPLANIATLEEQLLPRSLPGFQQRNSAKIQAVVFPGVTQGMALSAVEDAARDLLPNDVALDYAGESRQFKKESGGMVGLLLLAILLVYLVLAAQFHSFRDPFVILAASVPMAISGALLTIYLGGTTLNIYSQVGLVTLVGLIAKNGILVVEFANELQEKGLGKLNALMRASVIRFRPIAITTTATVFGHMLLIFVTGPGAEARNSIGIVLVAGMAIGSLLALFVVPIAYLLIAKDHGHKPAGPWVNSEPDDVPRAPCKSPATPPVHPEPAAVEKNRARNTIFASIAAGMLVRFSRGMTATALLWTLVEFSGKGSLLGWNSVIMIAAFAAGSVIAGHFVDRIGARRTTFLASLPGAALIAVAGCFLISEAPALILVMGISGLAVIAYSACLTSYDAALPDLAEKASLPLRKVNAADDLVDGLAGAMGAPTAGILIAWIGVSQTFWIAGGVLALGGILGHFVLPAATPKPKEDHSDSPWEGIRALWSIPLLAKLVGSMAVVLALFAAMDDVLLPVLTRDHEEGPAFLGLVIGASWLGLVGGAAYMLVSSLHTRPFPIYMAALALILCGTIFTALTPWDAFYPVTACIAGLGVGLLSPLISTVFQQSVDPSLRGRVFGTATAVVLCVSPVVVLICGFAVDRFGAQATLLAATVPVLLLLFFNPFHSSTKPRTFHIQEKTGLLNP